MGAFERSREAFILTNVTSSTKLNSRSLATTSIDTSGPSRDLYRSFKQIPTSICQNPRSGLLCCHRKSILTNSLLGYKKLTDTKM